LDVKINYELATPLACVVHRDNAQSVGRRLVKSLKNLIPRQLFNVPIQACIGVKVVASESISAMRKDVLAKCYGGDISRKKKLLQKQAKGKAKMKAIGKVNVPQEVSVTSFFSTSCRKFKSIDTFICLLSYPLS
jgi:GTP-binding protein LepA